ncbi:MAG: Gfo/Idh/MocA family oxidoreductase [Opitutaceae bacterium]|nr:Gfo/Idh/MocA family oxidoreductase [Opitutaceae bacterium]
MANDPPLRTLLVGLGRIGLGFHGPALLRQPGYQLVGVVDPLPERRTGAAVTWAVPAYADFDDALAELRPELVVIASPTRFHADQTRRALAAGAHVFCDKPVATGVEEFATMAEAARQADRRFLAYQPARFKPELLALRALLDRGLLGKVHLVKRARCNFVRRNDWQTLRAQGGGLLANYGSHCLDELLSLWGADPVRTVFCRMRTVVSAGDAEDVVKATLYTASGLCLDLDISQACALPGPAWQVVGAQGAAIYDAATRTWRVRYFRPEESPAPALQTGLAAENGSYNPETLSWREETFAAADFAEPNYYEAAERYFRDGAVPPVSLDESRQLLELIERCRRSADTGACA